MKDELSSLDVHFLVKELQSVVGARFQKAFARDKEKELFLQLHNTQSGKVLLRTQLPGLCYIASTRPEFPQIPPGFITFLRKRLSGTKVQSIEQLGMDRIITIGFQKKDEESYKLIIELIMPGNIILLGKKPIKGGLSDELILSLQTPQNYKDRTVRGGIPYESPPPAANLKEESEDVLVQKVLDSKMDSLVKGLAIGLNLGGVYAELICERLHFDKNKKISQTDVQKALQEIKILMEETPEPTIVGKDILFFTDTEGESFETISEVLDKKFTNYEMAEEVGPRKQKGSLVEQQELQKKGHELAVETNQRKGELLYEHYQELKPLLDKIKKGEDVMHPLIKKIDRKAGTITLEL